MMNIHGFGKKWIPGEKLFASVKERMAKLGWWARWPNGQELTEAYWQRLTNVYPENMKQYDDIRMFKFYHEDPVTAHRYKDVRDYNTKLQQERHMKYELNRPKRNN